MSTLKLSLLLSMFFLISACSQFAPFEDRRREPGTEYVYVGASKPGRPAICYNPLFYDREEVKAKADELCRQHKEKTHAEEIDNDIFSCRLFVPSKAYYKCVADK